ncbi:type IV pilus biogenesis protein PilP [Paraburkholderia fungorum]|uniref:type IV pilus biogenesis protein PilP n=1 Tax=Paraburkholderia fungorum TaxID=134537 RepID=UPI00402B8F06
MLKMQRSLGMLKETSMRKNNRVLLAIVASGMAATAVCAQTVPAVATVGDLASIQSQTLLGKAKLVREQVYADLRKYSDGQTGGAGGSAAQTDTGLPQVIRIVEANGVSEATLAYANGKIDAREGDRVPGGYVLAKIHPDTSLVQLKARNGRLFDVPVSSLAGLSATPSAPQQTSMPNGLVSLMPPNPMTAPLPQPSASAPVVPHITPSLAGPTGSSSH